ncbi:hypothetical protein HaLaN_22253 [Haematococcus lacustris]|uniref:Uncharacterized protein n=1 Tax=Haematococcus lacustris TaxID=44745 RepID=A0A699ZP46_HAELA|nr:hypothetical protein HaLaN_22253 [Haematococcus lacustris]
MTTCGMCQSGVPNMGLVIFMQVLSQYRTVFDSVYYIGIGGLVRGTLTGCLEHINILASAKYTIWVGAH